MEISSFSLHRFTPETERNRMCSLPGYCRKRALPVRTQLRLFRRGPGRLVRVAVLSLVLCLGFAGFPGWHQGSLQAAAGQGASTPILREFGGVAISPDGRYVAWASDSELYLTDLTQASAAPRKVGQGVMLNPLGFSSRMNDGVWSPDSRHVAFVGRCGQAPLPQLCVASTDAGTARQLTSLRGSFAEPRWSPDGRTLGVLFTENPPFPPGTYSVIPTPIDAGGVVEEFGFEQRFAVVDVPSGRMRLVSPRGLYVYEYDWSPDGTAIAATAAPAPGNNSWYTAQLYTLRVDSGVIRPLVKPGIQIQVPRWSPDGKFVAYIGGLMSGRSISIGDVYVVSVNSGRPRNLTPQTKATARRIVWTSPNRLLLTEFVHGQSGIAEADLSTGKIDQLWTGSAFSPEGAGFANFSVGKDGRTSALDLQSFQRPPEIWAGPIGAWKQVTHYNGEIHPAWGKVESVEWKSDEWNIQGWLYYPRAYNPHARYPMVVWVHGGPAYLQPAAWGGEPAELADAGYFVLCPNARGSVGEGEAFVRANIRDIGHGDLRDILAGVNKVLATLPIDENRLGIAGWSYGGYITMWAVTQTNRFRAAAAGAGISDWLSYAGQCDYPRWVEGHFADSVYADPLIYARSSPMNYIQNVKTPTLIQVGAGDGVCPAPQSLEFWRALRRLGVETELVVYPDEGHMIIKPEHIRDVRQRRIEWFDRFLK